MTCHACTLEVKESIAIFINESDNIHDERIVAGQLPDPAITETWCMNCDQERAVCTCEEEYLPIDMLQMAMWESAVEIYEINSKCENCIFVYSHECEPMREWMKQWVDNSMMDEPEREMKKLSGCDKYRSL